MRIGRNQMGHFHRNQLDAVMAPPPSLKAEDVGLSPRIMACDLGTASGSGKSAILVTED